MSIERLTTDHSDVTTAIRNLRSAAPHATNYMRIPRMDF
jgi:hypothetical protein